MEEVATRDARLNLAELLNRVAYGKERFVVTRHGKGLAALVPLDDVNLLEVVKRLVSRREVRVALEDAAENDTVSWEALKAELGL